jgi:hypothetical protein
VLRVVRSSISDCDEVPQLANVRLIRNAEKRGWKYLAAGGFLIRKSKKVEHERQHVKKLEEIDDSHYLHRHVVMPYWRDSLIDPAKLKYFAISMHRPYLNLLMSDLHHCPATNCIHLPEHARPGQ